MGTVFSLFSELFIFISLLAEIELQLQVERI